MVAVASPAQAGTSKGYDAYVACGVSKHAPAAHSCGTDSKKAAFFLSTDADVSYTVCVKFPNRDEPLCAPSQQAKRGHLYRNRITSTITGRHRVTWLVDGHQVGSFRFRVTD
jgi:hypothetical protein